MWPQAGVDHLRHLAGAGRTGPRRGQSYSTEGTGLSTLPMNLLTTAFAACVLKNVERFSQVLPFRYQEASIKVVAERQEDPSKMIRVTYSLHLVTDRKSVV